MECGLLLTSAATGHRFPHRERLLRRSWMQAFERSRQIVVHFGAASTWLYKRYSSPEIAVERTEGDTRGNLSVNCVMKINVLVAVSIVACIGLIHADTQVRLDIRSTCNAGCYSEMEILSSASGKGSTECEAMEHCQAECDEVFDEYNYQKTTSTEVCLAICGVQPQLRAKSLVKPETCQLCPDATRTIKKCESAIAKQIRKCKRRCRIQVFPTGGQFLSVASKRTISNIRFDGDKSSCDDDDGYGYYE
mmetsp:Transcript_5116/g.15302  ORF Transcript_5116/g.15302 Transcript_5116/m.15302 type:complete len:249 (+) Transcript_5116:53-799(+)